MRLPTLLLKHRFLLFFMVLAVLSAGVIAALEHAKGRLEQLKLIEHQRYHTTVLAHQLKQKTDAMTRHVMAFVSSEQPEFQQNYYNLWGQLKGTHPDERGIQQHYIDRLKDTGINDEELRTLHHAFEQLEALTLTQIEAMNTASGQFDDGQGNVKIALPNALMAKVMVFSQQYAEAASAIQHTINAFDAQQATRMNALAKQAEEDNHRAANFALGALVLLLTGSALALWRLYVSIKKPLDAGMVLAGQLAAGHLQARAQITRLDESGQVLTALNQIGSSLAHVIRQVREETQATQQAATRLAHNHADLSDRTNEQAANIQESVAATEQLAITIQHNMETAQASRDVIQQASEAAAETSQIVTASVRSMEQIKTDSSKIGEITHVINAIAFQTNILALNAAIEAARAGTHGRGFAVVADEVRNLATRSAAAARDIAQLITHSVQQLNEGSTHINEAGQAMDRIVSAVEKTRAMMAEVVSASQEQTVGIHNIAQAMQHLELITQKNQHMAHEAAQATQAQHDRIHTLTHTLSHFHIDDQTRKDQVTDHAQQFQSIEDQHMLYDHEAHGHVFDTDVIPEQVSAAVSIHTRQNPHAQTRTTPADRLIHYGTSPALTLVNHNA